VLSFRVSGTRGYIFCCLRPEKLFRRFSPFELVFGRTVRGPLKESWLTDDPPDSLLDQVSSLRDWLVSVTKLAQENLKRSQRTMKTWYDKKARDKSFRVGEKVLVLLPIPQHPLQARYCGLTLLTNIRLVGCAMRIC